MIKKLSKISFMLIILSVLLLSGCSQSVSEITANDDYVEKTVKVSGTVKSSMKLGPISGYTLVDFNEDEIMVSATKLPSDGDKITAKGTLKKGILGLGYYIEVDE